MRLNCRSCGTEIKAGGMNLDRMLAKCDACNAVFSFADQFDYASTREEAYQKFNVEQPKGIQIDNFGLDLKITRKWFSPLFFFLLFFTLFWNGIIWPILIRALLDGELLPVCFVSIHATIGLGLAYYTLALLINITEIKVGPQQLTIRHGPLPWRGNKNLAPADIKQLYCKEKISRGRRSANVTYEVRAITSMDTREDLVTGLSNAEEALFLEQEIERFLNIKDQPVRGEYQP